MLAFSNDYYGMIFRATQSVELFCAYKATRKLFIKEFEYEIYEDFFYINGNKYEYQDVIKCEIHYFDYFFINVLCLHIDMKNTSKSTILLYSEDLDEGIDYKDIPLFKFYESVSEHLRIS